MNLSLPGSIFPLFLQRLARLAALAGAVAVPAAAPAAVSRGFTQLLDSVVRIDVQETVFDQGTARSEASIGSGVVLSADGLVLTNAHVASFKAIEIDVTLANLERVGARLVGWDHWTDLALLRLDMDDVRRRHLAFAHAEFGDSERLFPGETVYAVGTPYGLARTVTKGIISNTQRYFEGDLDIDGYETGMFNNWLQTDAAINPGNSGGPLVTEDGRVVGITSRSYLGANNLGFAIPANVAKAVVAGLVRSGSIARSYIGIQPTALQDLEHFYSLALNTGALLGNVDAGSPAARAGLKVGDILLDVNGRPVVGRFPEQLPPIQNFIASQPVGSTLALTVKRGPRTMMFAVGTEELESTVGEEQAYEAWGLSVRKVSRAYARENRLADATGVLVIGVRPGFPADVAGLTAGDIVTTINRRPVASLDVVRTAHAAYEGRPEPVLFEVERERRVALFILKP